MGSGPTEKRVGPYMKNQGIIRNEWRIIKGLRADRKKGSAPTGGTGASSRMNGASSVVGADRFSGRPGMAGRTRFPQQPVSKITHPRAFRARLQPRQPVTP